MQKIIFYIFLSSAMFACKTNKVVSELKYEDPKELKVAAAHVQQEIPGTPEEKSKTYITILFSELNSDNVKLEKVKFIGDFYGIQTTDYRDEKTIKLDVTKSDFWNKSTTPQVQLYYSVTSKSVEKEISVTIKEPIYLP